MPTVRKYERQAETAALPGARLTAAETDVSTGAGLEHARAQKFGAMAETGGLVARIGLAAYSKMQAESRDKADQVALLEAENKLSKWENERLYGEQGALGVKGKDAMALPETLAGEYEKVTSDIEQGLGTDRQRQAFARVKSNKGAQLDLTIRRHVFGEMQTYERGELKAYIENAQQAAISAAFDPRQVGVELGKAVEKLRQHGPGLGLGPEALDAQIREVESGTHIGVINRLLAADQDKAASIYLEETRGQIDGQKIDAIEKALRVGTMRKRAQSAADEIIRAGGSLTDQREKAKAIDDPEERDHALAYIEHEHTVADKEQRDQHEERLRTSYDILDKTHDVAQIPPADWQAMEPAERHSARSYARQLAEGIPIKTDDAVFYGLMRNAMEDPQAFARYNLLTKKASLSSSDFQQLAGLQLSIRNGDRRESDKVLDDYRTENDVINTSLSLAGINPHPKAGTPEEKAVAQLRRMVGERTGNLIRSTGKKAVNADVQGVVDDLLSQSVTVPGSWWNIFPGGKPFFDSSKRVIDITLDDIPANERKTLESELRRAGRPVDDVTVLRYYIDARSRMRK